MSEIKLIVYTEAERAGMLKAFEDAQKKHGMYESLFAVATFILRHRGYE